jgi:hypothetical protein
MLDVPDQLRSVLEVDARAGRHAFARHLEEDRRLRHIAAAPPQAHRARIARCRDVAAPGAAEQHRVGIEPAHPALGFREHEAVLHESPAREIELAQHHGVAAAARETQDRTIVRARPRRGTAPDPVLAFGHGQGVDIEQDLPRRLVEAKALERGAPPQAAWVLGVEPEIVEPRSAPHDQRELVGPVEDRRQGVAVGGELSAAESP